MRGAKEMVAFQAKKINHPRYIKPYDKEKYRRKRAVDICVSGVIHDIIHKQILTDIPYHRACKGSKRQHFKRVFARAFVCRA